MGLILFINLKANLQYISMINLIIKYSYSEIDSGSDHYSIQLIKKMEKLFLPQSVKQFLKFLKSLMMFQKKGWLKLLCFGQLLVNNLHLMKLSN